ncbi:c-di-GMP phosphodiesterase [Ureibacillus massiliensis 4400831 = CIP 108448 = CCUG 49529]|uniref:C-di-GMP phosphodiesterase n=1 Tax=Ureibacillus massiliensis 4400831 = CIP 108448 = CCUG 49529 TaxID=1211035 RepID=A0A0A3J4A6_9BACL|nr:HD-GYP domain-containing protein [Ureibacillus massiliensis]KGR91839.1 c-di-GMP phosphodiesterase [Ureibacillus massiliensis 4400831 = CIP 108448 = CCUG 49529]
MEATYVNIDESYIGKTVAQDIFANTQYPILKKDTVITEEHFHILKVFQISRVLLYKDFGKKVVSIENTKKNIEEEIEKQTFEVQTNAFQVEYEEAVSQYKKEFSNWESGAKIDIVKIRGIILPLIEKILADRSIMFDLNSYSNPKDYMYHHCVATGLISSVIAQKLGFDKGVILQMATAGSLADCGMAKIPARIRDKKQALNQAEFNEIRKHPIYSFQLVKDLPALKEDMKQAIIEHHERLDGSGYPRGLKLDNISVYSQIIAIADTFHAMTSERIYRSKESPFKVVEMIKESEFGKFNIKVVSALMNIVVDLPIGTKVELSNFERGEVMFVNQFSPTRPLVKLLNTGNIIDLSQNRGIYIERILTN